jgi:hypothetical protein
MKFIAVPSGWASHMDSTTGKTVTEPTYSVIDPHVKVKLTADDRKMLSATNPQWANAPEGTEVPLDVVNSERLVRGKVHNVQSYVDQLATENPKLFKDGKAGNVMTAIQDRTLREALNNAEIQMAHGAGTDIHYSILDALLTSKGGPALAQKLGIDPDKARDYLDEQHHMRMTADALAKTGGIGPKSLADQTQVQSLQASIKGLPDSDQKDFQSYLTEPDEDGNINMSKGDLAKGQAAVNARVTANMNMSTHQALTGGNPTVLKAWGNNVVEGSIASVKNLPPRGDAREKAVLGAQAEASARGLDPNRFADGPLETRYNTYLNYTSGKNGNSEAKQMVSFDAFLTHDAEANEALKGLANQTWGTSNTPYLNTALDTVGKQVTNNPAWSAFKTSLAPVRNEINNFLAAGYSPKTEESEAMNTILDPHETPARIQAALKQLTMVADARLSSIGKHYTDVMYTNYPNLLSPQSKAFLQSQKINSLSLPYSTDLPRGWQGGKSQQMTDKNMARAYYNAAGNDKDKAKDLAKMNGWILN